MNIKHHTKHARGFSVIEVLIAVLVLGVGLAAMTQLHKSNIDGGAYAKQSAIAADLAQQKVNDLTPKLSTATPGTDSIVSAGTTYTRTWTVSEATSDGTTRVNVSVTWPGATAPIALAAVGQNYTPDQAYRNLKIIPVVAKPSLIATFTSASSASCVNSESPTMIAKGWTSAAGYWYKTVMMATTTTVFTCDVGDDDD